MSLPARRLAQFRWLIRAMAIWATLSVSWFELGGVPHLYGWPLCVIRPEGCEQPPVLVWIVDLIGWSLVVATTWFLAIRCNRAILRGFQFRLATLFGVMGTCAVVAAVYRVTMDNLDVLSFSLAKSDELATIVAVDFIAFWNWVHPWMRPVGSLLRLGLWVGLGCFVWVAGWFFANLASWRPRVSKTPT